MSSAQMSELSLLTSQLSRNGAFAINSPDNGEQAYVARPPWLDAPDGSYPFDQIETIPLPTTLVTVDTAVLTYVVPDGYDGVINAYSCNLIGVGLTDGSGDVVWRLLQTMRAVRNFQEITVQRGTPQIPRELSTGIRIYSNDVIEFVVRHVNDPTINGQVVCSISGYIYPSRKG